MQAANEVGVPLKDHGYNGDLTAKQVGSVGGQMVKKMLLTGKTIFRIMLRIRKRIDKNNASVKALALTEVLLLV